MLTNETATEMTNRTRKRSPAAAAPLAPGLVRLLEREPTAAERFGHAAALLRIIERESKLPPPR